MTCVLARPTSLHRHDKIRRHRQTVLEDAICAGRICSIMRSSFGRWRLPPLPNRIGQRDSRGIRNRH